MVAYTHYIVQYCGDWIAEYNKKKEIINKNIVVRTDTNRLSLQSYPFWKLTKYCGTWPKRHTYGHHPKIEILFSV
jgi:hypothetical protein